MSTPPAQAQHRALLILQVQSGQITATEAARQLGLSRKSYYQWEKRALKALLESLQTQPPGRPPKSADPEKVQLRQQLQRSDAKKNSRSCKPSSSKRAPPSPPPG